ncbi:serine/threonine protein kinase [Catenulispora pinisilvae]|uniref:serine/threonine protein kinase n=1 Tax=Catenulispora pinisilvae TaxID=2705253 RepID=UPI001E46724D|nr:serine/threonine-protein kinase [Catenulispora pinisilvae]
MMENSRFETLDASDLPGVAGYTFRARIGVGGMGRVYLSFTPGGRAVAVKVVRPDYAADGEFRRRFKLEVSAARSVEGFYTAPVVDADPEGPVPWLATAYIPGPSLADAVRRHGPLPEQAVFRLLAGVAEGLKAVHARGLVHRDLKPANVLLAADGPRVIDFGIAHAVDATTASLTVKRMGTPAYMAPEQVLGREVGTPADVFALGGLMYFAATGRTAFGEGLAVFHRITDLAPDLQDCPTDLGPIIERCLAKEAGARPTLDEVITLVRDQFAEKTLAHTSSWLPQTVVAEFALYDVAAAPAIGGTDPGPTAQPGPAVRSPGVSRPPAADRPPLPPTQIASDATQDGSPFARPAPYPQTGQPGQQNEPYYQYGPPAPPPTGTNPAMAVMATVGVLALVIAVVLGVTQPWKHTSSDNTGQTSNESTTSTTTTTPYVPPTTSEYVPPTTSEYVPPTTDYLTTTTPAFSWSNLNEAASDTTPQTAEAVLPETFTDSDGRVYKQQGAGADPCVENSQTSSVQNLLSSNHCSAMVDGSYTNDAGTILISIEVIVFPDATTASSVESQLANTKSGDLGFWCPKTGTGASVCDNGTNGAMSRGNVRADYRYVVNSDAVYIDLAASGNDTALQNGAQMAAKSAGPEVYWSGRSS